MDCAAKFASSPQDESDNVGRHVYRIRIGSRLIICYFLIDAKTKQPPTSVCAKKKNLGLFIEITHTSSNQLLLKTIRGYADAELHISLDRIWQVTAYSRTLLGLDEGREERLITCPPVKLRGSQNSLSRLVGSAITPDRIQGTKAEFMLK